ncbi:hypothetical protein SAMN06265375_1011442 [Muriicola jejuensis]|uniref:Uncharacterized protein n=1 Tax=Muriicola jejuensis TaxID=504488 RepID=A0A6P0U7H3_9FLAO|nr:hypothetical protein [Muriicola jejuensis]NER09075.1 hypothetical protein [Muriicola jejuensis]SMP11437.1 hypothetical protein SAMN06265375_1011442 [Muriicola jejuensis]
MRKTLILFALAGIYSCSDSDSSSPDIELIKIEKINYQFAGDNYSVSFEVNRNGDYQAIKDEAFQKVNDIIDANEKLVFHLEDKSNIMLFKSNEELEKYLENLGRPLTKLNSNESKASSPYECLNLELFYDSYLGDNKRIHWYGYNTSLGQPNSYCIILSNCWFPSSDNVNRLKNFATTTNWTISSSGPVICASNQPIGNNPNDKLSSVIVRNVFAQFYENANYGGKSFTMDARYGTKVQVNNRLKSLRFGTFGNWDDRVSSVRLSF